MAIDTKKWLLNSHVVKLYQFPPLVENKTIQPEIVDDDFSLMPESPSGSDDLESDAIPMHDYQESFNKGYQEGKEQGFQSGLLSGEEEGKRIGFAEGIRQGREEGFVTGKHDIDSKLTEIIVPLMALKSLLEEGYEKQINQQQQLIVDLVRRVTKQVIRCELALQPQQILTLVEETIASLPSDISEIEIHLEPSAVKELQLLAFDKLKHWKIVPDPEISQGGCRIVTNKCDADASIETRLNSCLDKVEEHLLSSKNQSNDQLINDESVETIEQFSNDEITASTSRSDDQDNKHEIQSQIETQQVTHEAEDPVNTLSPQKRSV